MKALVVGGAGNLGRSFVKALNKAGVKPINLDINLNSDAETNILVKKSVPLVQQIMDLKASLSNNLNGQRLCSVICTAGGWQAGSITDDDFLDSINRMHELNIETAALAGHLASKYVSQSGLVILTGASVALHPSKNTSTLGYGISKTSTHFLVESIAVDPHFSKNKITVLGILPQVIDTSENRLRLPSEDSKHWTKPDEISQMCVQWITDIKERPKTGSLLNVRSSKHESDWNE
eukprot:gene6223-12608_t